MITSKYGGQIIGILFMVLHCFFISVLAAMVRGLSGKFHVFEILFVHCVVAFLLLLPVVVCSGKYKQLKTDKLHLHVIRAVLGVLSMSLYFYACMKIPLTEARAIALTGPLVGSLFAIIFLKEKAGWHRMIALFIGLVGALFILRPGGVGFTFVSLFVVAAVVMWATIEMIVKVLARTESTVTQLFYLTGLMSVLSLPGAWYYWVMPSSFADVVWLVAIGVVFLLNVVAVFNAYKHADVTTLMPFDFSGMVFTVILAYLFFGEIIDMMTMLGAIIIMISSLYVVRREVKRAKDIYAVPQQSEL